jgi:hypothetical protein
MMFPISIIFYSSFAVTQVNTISSEENENSSSFFQTNYKCSMCAPRVTRHTSCRYSSSSQTACESCSDTLHCFFPYWRTPSWFSIANAAPVLKLWIPLPNWLTAGCVSPKFEPKMPLNAHNRLVCMKIKNTECLMLSTSRHFPQLTPGGR